MVSDPGAADLTFEVTQDAVADAGVEELATDRFTAAGGTYIMASGVTVAGSSVSMAGADGVSLTAPVTLVQAPIATQNGTLMLTREAGSALQVEVQGVEGGTARMLVVADQNYSASPVHEYAYKVAVPEGTVLTQATDGTVALLQASGSATDVAFLSRSPRSTSARCCQW